MKHKIKSIFLFALAVVFLLACEKDEVRVTFEGGKAPVLTVSSTNALTLAKANENYNSLQFQWTNPEFTFSNGVNTQDVIYTLEVDTAGSNFTNPKLVKLAYPKEVSASFKVRSLNTALSGLELKDFVPHTFEFRVKATLSTSTVAVYSNVVSITISTYLDVVYPVPDKLFITGAATPKGWMAGGDAPEGSQEFAKINSFTFQISGLQMNASQAFLFVPVYGNWDNKYGFTGDGLANNPSGDFFKPGGNDFISPGNAKAYKITVNFKTGKYTFE
jgi:starch-binding outer membrane protein SusE/F